jgi:hypothetical protein
MGDTTGEKLYEERFYEPRIFRLRHQWLKTGKRLKRTHTSLLEERFSRVSLEKMPTLVIVNIVENGHIPENNPE